jgi:hypothetical protein
VLVGCSSRAAAELQTVNVNANNIKCKREGKCERVGNIRVLRKCVIAAV